MEYSDPKRLVSKNFYCPSCLKNFKRLVKFNKILAPCPICDRQNCNEISELRDSAISKEQGDSLREKLLTRITPFSVSPFSNSIKRSHSDLSSILEDDILTVHNDDFFLDNFNSNFISSSIHLF